MAELTCIVCPVGCSLSVEGGACGPDELIVKGNKCPRGSAYALEEVRAPKRTVTATCAIAAIDAAGQTQAAPLRRVPVKTSSPCLKEKIPALLADIYKTRVKLPVKAGDAVIANWNGEGIDIVATRTLAGYTA